MAEVEGFPARRDFIVFHADVDIFSVVFPQIPPMSEVCVVSRISPSELQLVKVSY